MNKPEEIRSVPWGWIEATMAWVGSLPLGGPRPGNQGGIGGLGPVSSFCFEARCDKGLFHYFGSLCLSSIAFYWILLQCYLEFSFV